jgi:thioredoxin reductase (NADPH)
MYACDHLADAATRRSRVVPSSEGCQECLESGDEWVHLRLCLSCGHVGCCDDSKNKHATRHYRATQHPVIRSFEPGEEWGYCYPDEAFAERLPARDEETAPVHYEAP